MIAPQRTLRFVATSLALSILLSAVGYGYAELEGKININTAKTDHLVLLYRVGEKMAERIIEYREQHGDFKTIEELMHVRGIGEKTFEQLKPFLAVSGDTTLRKKE